jgi:hypothetical protein
MLSVVCWSICTIRNKITFEQFILRSPVTIIFTVYSFLKHWAGLYGDEEKGANFAGADQLKRKASEVAGAGSSAENPSAARIGRSKCLMLSGG